MPLFDRDPEPRREEPSSERPKAKEFISWVKETEPDYTGRGDHDRDREPYPWAAGRDGGFPTAEVHINPEPSPVEVPDPPSSGDRIHQTYAADRTGYVIEPPTPPAPPPFEEVPTAPAPPPSPRFEEAEERRFFFDDRQAAREDRSYGVGPVEPEPPSEDLPDAPLPPGLALQVEGLEGRVAALSDKIEALADTVLASRSLASDQLTDYTKMVIQMMKGSTSDLQEYRSSNERLFAEMRWNAGEHKEGLRWLGGQIERLATDSGGLVEAVREVAGNSKEVAESTDRLARQLKEGLELLAEELLGRLNALRSAVEGELEGVRVDLARMRNALPDARSANPHLGAELDLVMTELGQLRDSVVRRDGDDHALNSVLVELRETVADLNASDQELRGCLSELTEQMGKTGEEVASIRRRMPLRVGATPVELSAQQLDDLVAAVGARLHQSLQNARGLAVVPPSARRR